jgi:hypothetical protein
MNRNKPIRDFGNEHLPDVQFESLLANFRNSVHSWSAQEYAKVDMPLPVVGRRFLLRTPLCVAVGVAVVALIVALPMLYRSGNTATVASNPVAKQTVVSPQTGAPPAVNTLVAAIDSSAAPLHEHSTKPVASMNDEELMAAVDKDVSQRSPDAMSPLVELMSSDGSATSTQN